MSPSKNRDADLKALFTALGSNDSDRRYHALVEAQALPPERFLGLVRVAERRRKWISRLRTTYFHLVTASIAAFLMWRPLGESLLVTFLSVCLAVIVFHIAFPRMPWQDENLLRVLENMPDSLCVESVLTLLGRDKWVPRARLHRLLLQRLPNLSAEETCEWTDRQKEALKGCLSSWYKNEELAFCILKVLPEIGAVWALEAVSRLAKLKSEPISKLQHGVWAFSHGMRRHTEWEAHGLDRWEMGQAYTSFEQRAVQEQLLEERLRRRLEADAGETAGTDPIFLRMGEVATECLLRLQAKIQEEEAAQVLLRAYTAGHRSEDLLRPAIDRWRQIERTDLLRPGSLPAASSEEPL